MATMAAQIVSDCCRRVVKSCLEDRVLQRLPNVQQGPFKVMNELSAGEPIALMRSARKR